MLYVFCGIPGSWKSTFAKEIGIPTVICPDTIREAVIFADALKEVS